MRKNLMVILTASMLLAVSGCSSESTTETTTAEVTTTVADTTVADTTVADTTVADTTEEVVDDTTEYDPVVGGDESDEWVDDWSDPNGDMPEVECSAEKLGEAFKAEVANTTDIQTLAEKLSAYEVCGFDCGTMEVEEGFLNGFSDEIKGFTKGIQFGPWIGSVPFIGYVFETEDAEGLVETLKANADPRWNICTEAKETLVESEGNIVFFCMCPGPEEF